MGRERNLRLSGRTQGEEDLGNFGVGGDVGASLSLALSLKKGEGMGNTKGWLTADYADYTDGERKEFTTRGNEHTEGKRGKKFMLFCLRVRWRKPEMESALSLWKLLNCTFLNRV